MNSVDTSRVRETLRTLPEPRFYSIQWRRLRRAALRRADRLIARGWPSAGGGPSIPLEVPFPWWEASGKPYERRIHAFEPLDPLLEAHSWSGDPQYLVVAAAVGADWAAEGRAVPAAGEPVVAGNRAYRLGYLLRAGAAEEQVGEREVQLLLEAAVADAKALFAGTADQGALARACGLMSLTGYLGEAVDAIGRMRQESRNRAVRAFRVRFSADGVHLGHSPVHHAAVLGMLASVLDAGLADDAPFLRELRDLAEDALAWMTLPDGSLAGFGDTSDTYVSPVWEPQRTAVHLVGDRYRRASMIHAATAGAMGDAPGGGVRGFPDGGLAFVKVNWPASPVDQARSTYVGFQAGFHSTLHKHSDDLSFVWFDRGRRLLVDAGFADLPDAASRWAEEEEGAEDQSWIEEERDTGEDGADVAEPGADLADEDHREVVPAVDPSAAVLFVRSARAHNTIEIDGHDYDPARPPYGSALRKWGEISGLPVLEGRVRHGSVIHRRSIAVAPGRWLLVVDDLADEAGRAHEFRQWFQAAEGLAVTQSENRAVLAGEGVPRAWVAQLQPEAAAVRAVRGRAASPIRGWRAPTTQALVPVWSFGYVRQGSKVRFATLFTLDGPATRLEVDADRVGWKHAGERVEVLLRDGSIGDIDLKG